MTGPMNDPLVIRFVDVSLRDALKVAGRLLIRGHAGVETAAKFLLSVRILTPSDGRASMAVDDAGGVDRFEQVASIGRFEEVATIGRIDSMEGSYVKEGLHQL